MTHNDYFKTFFINKEFYDNIHFAKKDQAMTDDTLNKLVERAKVVQDNYHLIPAEFRAGADSFMKKTEDLYVKHTLAVLAKKIGEPQSLTNKSVSLFHNDLGKDFALRVLDRCEKILVALGFKVRIKHEGHFSELSIAGQENSTKSL